MRQLSFFKRLEKQLLSGKKTATIRSVQEGDYQVGQSVDACRHEDGGFICRLTIRAIEPVSLDSLTRVHAQAENLPFVFLLKRILRRLYNEDEALVCLWFEKC